MQLPSTARRRRTLAALVCAFTIPWTAGCSGSSDEAGPAPASSSGSARPVAPDYKMGVVTGRLSKTRQHRLLGRVRPVIDDWVEAAYLGDYPRTDFDFPGFSARASRRAEHDPVVASNASLGQRLSSATLAAQHVRLDVLARGNHAAGVTARFRLDLRLAGEGLRRRDRLVGRLFLTYVHHDWQIFGYSITRRSL